MMNKQRHNTTNQIAAWTAAIRLQHIPVPVRRRAEEHLLDGFATMLAGAEADASRQIDRHLRALGGNAEATVIGTRIKLPAQHAALANGVRGHALDYDDAQLSTLRTRPYGQLTHPTSPILAAVAALAERIHARGAEFLTAYIVGVEVACRLGDAIDPRHYIDGFHPTGTIATFGAAAGCAHLLQLDTPRIRAALGIAGSLAAGVRAQRGTMAKALNAGRAAENGVMASLLAAGGFTASTDIFDDSMGYFSAACYGEVNRKLIKLGNPFFFSDPGIAIKFYPCAAVMHPALDGLIELVQRHALQPRQVKHVRIRLGYDAALPLVYDRPRTGLEGKFSLPFSAALAIIHRGATLLDYTDDQVQNPQIREMMKCVKLVRTGKLKSIGNLGTPAEIELTTRDGRRYRHSALVAKGHPKKPLSQAELNAKFYQCARGRLSRGRVEAFIEASRHIQTIRSIGAVLRLLCPRRH
ncbi:MAG: MmgE/PrpD family protein [Deltaproteobacteria bacterium]